MASSFVVSSLTESVGADADESLPSLPSSVFRDNTYIGDDSYAVFAHPMMMTSPPLAGRTLQLRVSASPFDGSPFAFWGSSSPVFNGSVGDTPAPLTEAFSHWAGVGGLVLAVMYLISLYFIAADYFGGGRRGGVAALAAERGVHHQAFYGVDGAAGRIRGPASFAESTTDLSSSNGATSSECSTSDVTSLAEAAVSSTLTFQEAVQSARRGANLWGRLINTPDLHCGDGLAAEEGYTNISKGIPSAADAAASFADGPRPYDLAALSAAHGVKHIAVIMDGNRRFGKQKAREAKEKKSSDGVVGEEGCNWDCSQQQQQGGGGVFSAVYRRSVAVLKAAGMGEKVLGHKAGGEKLLEFAQYCISFGIPILTVYAFSTENWSRPQEEIDILMAIFTFFFERMRVESRKNGIYCRFIVGDAAKINPDILALMRDIENETRLIPNRRITVNVLVSYGSRLEIAQAAQSLADDGVPITEAAISRRLLRSLVEVETEAATKLKRKEEGCAKEEGASEERAAEEASLALIRASDPDIIFRTSGEARLSNFLLFQSAYSEFIFTSKAWPAVEAKDLEAVLVEFCCRHRRFGA